MSSLKIERMRHELMGLYDGVSWKERVSKWEDNRVIATYLSCQKYGRFEKKRKADHKKKSTNEYYRQMTIFDYI